MADTWNYFLFNVCLTLYPQFGVTQGGSHDYRPEVLLYIVRMMEWYSRRFYEHPDWVRRSRNYSGLTENDMENLMVEARSLIERTKRMAYDYMSHRAPAA